MADIRPLVPELAEVAQTKLNEDEERIPQEIATLRSWMEQHPCLNGRTDDQFLVAFLRFCKYDQEAAQKRIEYFYNYKTVNTDLLKNRRIDEKVLAIGCSGIFTTLPNPVGPGGPRIHFTRMGLINTSLFSVRDIFRFHVFRSEMEINSDDNWVISGVLEVLDFSKIPFSLLRQFEPSLFKKMAAFLEFAIPTNLMGTHIVNASKEAQLILNLVRLCMKEKELLHIHSNLESLQKVIGKEYLPVEYGGSNGSIEDSIGNFNAQLMEYSNYFDEEERYGLDKNLCGPTSSSTNKVEGTEAPFTELPVETGTDGSFRKLTFD